MPSCSLTLFGSPRSSPRLSLSLSLSWFSALPDRAADCKGDRLQQEGARACPHFTAGGGSERLEARAGCERYDSGSLRMADRERENEGERERDHRTRGRKLKRRTQRTRGRRKDRRGTRMGERSSQSSLCVIAPLAMLLRANGKFHLVVMSAVRKLDLKKVKVPDDSASLFSSRLSLSLSLSLSLRPPLFARTIFLSRSPSFSLASCLLFPGSPSPPTPLPLSLFSPISLSLSLSLASLFLSLSPSVSALPASLADSRGRTHRKC